MSGDTEKKWFSFFMVMLTPVAMHAKSLGHTGTVMLYAALIHFGRVLEKTAQLSDADVKAAQAVADEMKDL